MRRLYKIMHGTLRSLRFTAVMLVSISACYLAGLLVTQKALFQSAEQYRLWRSESLLHTALDALWITEIYTSPLMLVLLGLFFINLVTVAIDRVPLILRKAYLTGENQKVDAVRIRGAAATLSLQSTISADALRKQVEVFFLRRRWTIIPGVIQDTFVAVKNRFSPLGFLLFHGSFLLCLLGGVLITYTRFSGTVGVAEGEVVRGKLDQLGTVSQKSLLLRTLPEMSLKIEKIETRYEEGVPSDLNIDLDSIIAGVSRRARVKINEPLSQGAVTLVAKNIGLAPMVVVTSPSGEDIDTLFVKLNVLKGRSDSFRLGSRNQYLVRVTYFPDYVVYNGVETTRSSDPRNPAFHLVITSKDVVVYDGTIRLGEMADMDGFRVSFREIRYWVYFQVVREYGQWPLIAGFLLGCMGLVMRLIFYQKRIQVMIEERDGGSAAYLLGQAEYFGYTFAAEMITIAGNLQREMNSETMNEGDMNA